MYSPQFFFSFFSKFSLKEQQIKLKGRSEEEQRIRTEGNEIKYKHMPGDDQQTQKLISF